MKYITILVPCYNEEESIPIFYKRVSQIIGSFVDINFDFLFVLKLQYEIEHFLNPLTS